MAPSAALTSDHVNYLIFRYLQEAGHENTATAFYRDWHRTAEFRDPENYPFAPAVRRNELVSIIQTGLRHDDLEAQVGKNERRFRLTRVTSRDALAADRQQGAALENGTASASASGSRPGSSSAKRKGRASMIRAQGSEFPTPAPKRRRRSEDAQLNGDVMDVDAASPSAPEVEEDGEVASPAVISEPETMEAPERYDSMDVAVQTDVKTGPKTSTVYWKIDRPDATIFHSFFSPNLQSGTANTLLTAGESLCRFYRVPDKFDNERQLLSVDEPTLPSGSAVTAAAWHPNGVVAFLAADTIRPSPTPVESSSHDSEKPSASRSALFSHDCNTGAHVEYAIPPLLDPAGIVLAIRFNDSGSKVLVLRTNLIRGFLLVYNATNTEADKNPVAWSIYEQQVLDAAWLGEDNYIVVGENDLVEVSRVVDAPRDNASIEPPAANEVNFSGIVRGELDMPETAHGMGFDKVRIFSTGNKGSVIVMGSTKSPSLLTGQSYQHDGESEVTFTSVTKVAGNLTALAFEPLRAGAEPAEPVLLATALQGHGCRIYSCKLGLDENNNLVETEVVLREMAALHTKDSEVLALAWSPDGSFLAVSGLDLVEVWEVDALVKREDSSLEPKTQGPHKPLVRWRPNKSEFRAANGRHEEVLSLWEPNLSWSADGQRLAFAVDHEVAVIQFRPPLGKTEDAGKTNGYASP